MLFTSAMTMHCYSLAADYVTHVCRLTLSCFPLRIFGSPTSQTELTKSLSAAAYRTGNKHQGTKTSTIKRH